MGEEQKKRSMKWKIGTGKRELEHQLNWAWMVAEWVTEMGCETVCKAACGSDLRDGFAESERGFNRKAWQNPFSVMGICHASPVFPWAVSAKPGETNRPVGKAGLFCKSKLLHKCLWLRIVTAEVTIDDSLILYAALLKDLLAECVRNFCIEDSFLLEE